MPILNAEREAKVTVSAAKKVEETAEKAQKKVYEFSKRSELLPGFEQELQQKDTNGILGMSDARLWLYIRYYFHKKVVNLTKTKKNELKAILHHFLRIIIQ